MLKNRQSSKAPVNLKRPAPSNVSAEPEPVSTPMRHTLPHRSSTFPTQIMPRPNATQVPSRPRQSFDNAQSGADNRPINKGTWITSTPELVTETITSPEPTPATSLNPSFANPEPSSLAWPQQFNNPNNLPDLMPIMFPSDDPFAYPTQPMSTLEDDHFRHDQTGMSSPQFPFDSTRQSIGMGQSTPSDLSGASASTPAFDAFGNMPNFNVGASSGVRSSVPSRLQANTQSMNSSRLHSPISQGQTPSETLSSPDLVSIPNQNFVWQGYNFQPTTMGPDSSTVAQNPSMPNGLPDVNMGSDENTMRMNMDLGISFDDLFGNNVASRPNGAPNDDWTQWMNTGV